MPNNFTLSYDCLVFTVTNHMSKQFTCFNHETYIFRFATIGKTVDFIIKCLFGFTCKSLGLCFCLNDNSMHNMSLFLRNTIFFNGIILNKENQKIKVKCFVAFCFSIQKANNNSYSW